jgi:hypothetical protein
VFLWRFLDGTGEELGASGRFPDQGGAEAWIGQAWEDLREQGVEEVVLIDDETGRPVYRMSLEEPA